MKSAIYRGHIRHRRFSPKAHDFRYALALFYVDLSEIASIFSAPPLLSTSGPSVLAFRPRDYLSADQVRQLVWQRTGTRCNGPIRILTQLSYLGFCFNPVSFYYCFDDEDRDVAFVVSQITNTPWNERFEYVTPGLRSEFNKEFHVSPFLPMEMRYRWKFSAPSNALSVHMENFDPSGALVFDATLTMKRRELTRLAMLQTVASYPLLTGKAALSIYLQAFALWIKQVPFFPHPNPANEA